MKIVIRTDSSEKIGSGHLMRCLTLLDELCQRDSAVAVSFVCRELPGNLIQLVKNKGYEVHPLPCDSKKSDSSPEGATLEADTQETQQILDGIGQVDWLIVDHYGLDAQWETAMRPMAKNIMVIDDLANRPHDCDLLLDQNLYEDMEIRYDALLPEHCSKLLGPKYALLRPEFSVARNTLRERDGNVRRLLIFFGGSDHTNETAKALEAIKLLRRPDIAVDVVVGASNSKKEEIKEQCSRMPEVTYYCQVENMAELMARADLAIGAGGSTTWERCCMGLPSLVVTIADNQVEASKTLARQGYILYLGHYDKITGETLASALGIAFQSPEWLIFMGIASSHLVDGKGAERVSRNLLKEHVLLRPVAGSDRENLYRWRNAEENRRYSHNDKPISMEEHEKWFEASLSNPKRILLIGEVAQEPIGVLRYDLSGESAKVSVYLVPGKYGRGYGVQLVEAGALWLKTHRPEIRTQLAEVLPANEASIKTFLDAGFAHQYSVYEKGLT